MVIADYHGARFTKQVVGLAVPLHIGRSRNHRYTKAVRLQEASRVIQGFLALELGSIRLVKKFLGLVTEFLFDRLVLLLSPDKLF
jgi:hypothetical protein